MNSKQRRTDELDEGSARLGTGPKACHFEDLLAPLAASYSKAPRRIGTWETAEAAGVEERE